MSVPDMFGLKPSTGRQSISSAGGSCSFARSLLPLGCLLGNDKLTASFVTENIA